MADPVIKLNIDASGAVNGLDQLDSAASGASRTLKDIRGELKSVANELSNLDSGSDEFAKLTQKAGALKDEIKDISESINANAGPAFENAGNNAARLQGQLASLDFDGAAQSAKGLAQNIKGISFKDLQGGITKFGSSLASLGKALLANPIILLAGAIAALILNFDKLKTVLDVGVNPATRDFVEATQEASKASEVAIKAFDLEERRLRALGVAEGEIATQRRALLVQRLNDLRTEAIALAKLQGEQKANLDSSLADINNFFNPLQQLRGVFKQAFGASAEDVAATTEQLNSAVSAVEEIDVQIRELDKKTTDNAKAEGQKRNDNARAAAAERAKIAADEEKAILDERLKARNAFAEQLAALEGQIRQRELEVAQGGLAELQQTELQKLVIKQNAAKAAEEIDKQLRATEIALASDALSAISSLTDAFAGQSEQSARRAFQLNKAASIAQAIISTYQGVNAIFASSAANPTAVLNPAFPFIQAGIAVAAGLANVAKIAKTKFGDTSGSGGGGGPRPSSGGGGGSNTPASGFAQFNVGDINNRPNQPTPAYVLASDVKTQMEAAQKVQDQARL